MTTIMERKNALHILDETGDTKINWDASIQAEVDEAKKTFNTWKKKGYLAYRVDKKGNKAEVMHDFDPDVELMILAPPMQGG